MTARSRTVLGFAGLGIAVTSISLAVPLSYDEGNWIVDVRRWSAGESLYSDIPENKTPLLLLLVRALDAAPGSFDLARSLYLGVAAILLAIAVRPLAMRLGVAEPGASRLGLIAGSAGALQAVFTVNFELPAALLILFGLNAVAAGRAVVGGLTAAAASGFDVRAVVLLPGVALFAHAVGGKDRLRRTTLPMGSVVAAWIATVVLVPDLRFSLVEVNIATRAVTTNWHPLDTAYAILRGAAFPLGASLVQTSRGGRPAVRRAAIVLLAAGAGIALASLQPFDKYWSLALPGIVLLACSRIPATTSPASIRWLAVAAVGLSLTATHAVSSNMDQNDLVGRYERAAVAIDRSLPAGATIVRFDGEPFLGLFLLERDRTPSSVLDYVVADTSRQRELVARFEAAITDAFAIVDDGALSAPQEAVDPPYRRLWRVFDRHRATFACIRAVEGLTVRYRDNACPAASG